MTSPHTPRRYLVLITMLVALLAGTTTLAMAAERNPLSSSPGGLAGSGFLPILSLSSCGDIRAAFPSARDGVYPVLTDDNTLLTVFCYDMAGTPRDYIDLANTSEDANFSQYTAGGASPGTDVRTSFTKLRIDPATLMVDLGDLTFATSTGRLQHSSETRGPDSPFVTSMPYGVAMSCTSRPDGVANINLQGTPFIVEDTFELGGFASDGSTNVSEDKQTVDLNGGGYCGWISSTPTIALGYSTAPDTFRLNLACAPSDLQAAQPRNRFCIKFF